MDLQARPCVELIKLAIKPYPGDRPRYAGDAGRAVGDLQVDEDDADNLRKPQRRNGQVVAAQPQRRQADNGSDEPCGDGADQYAGKEASYAPRSSQARDEYGAGIGADGHEARVPQRKLAGEPGDEVEAHCQYDVDADGHQRGKIIIGQDAENKQRLYDDKHCRQTDALHNYRFFDKRLHVTPSL